VPTLEAKFSRRIANFGLSCEPVPSVTARVDHNNGGSRNQPQSRHEGNGSVHSELCIPNEGCASAFDFSIMLFFLGLTRKKLYPAT
jgi:hypothetical protein